MHYISIFKAINNFQGTFCTYMLIKAMALESRGFSELQKAVWGITADMWQPSSNKLFFFPCSVLVCVPACVKRRVSSYISLPYLCGLPLQSPWHLDNKGHIWKSKSAPTPMLIYSYIYRREAELVKMGEYLPPAEDHMLNETQLKLTVCELHEQALMQLINMTCIMFRTVIIVRELGFNWCKA